MEKQSMEQMYCVSSEQIETLSHISDMLSYFYEQMSYLGRSETASNRRYFAFQMGGIEATIGIKKTELILLLSEIEEQRGEEWVRADSIKCVLTSDAYMKLSSFLQMMSSMQNDISNVAKNEDLSDETFIFEMGAIMKEMYDLYEKFLALYKSLKTSNAQ